MSWRLRINSFIATNNFLSMRVKVAFTGVSVSGFQNDCNKSEIKRNKRIIEALLNWLSLACRRKLHKCTLVFKCLNNLVPKYLTQFFTRNRAFHDHATRRSNDLHPPKPKRNMGKGTFKYTGTIYFNALPACIKSAPSLSNLKKLIIKHFYL